MCPENLVCPEDLGAMYVLYIFCGAASLCVPRILAQCTYCAYFVALRACVSRGSWRNVRIVHILWRCELVCPEDLGAMYVLYIFCGAASLCVPRILAQCTYCTYSYC